jgi:hypothetical protein
MVLPLKFDREEVVPLVSNCHRKAMVWFNGGGGGTHHSGRVWYWSTEMA